MKNHLHTGWILIVGFLLMVSCSKKEDAIDLSANYLQVADIIHYCSGSCDETDAWENSQVWVKGNIRDLDNETVMNSYFDQSRFYLEDIRNGFYIDIRIVSSKDEIFDKILKARKTDRFYIKGTAVAIFAYEDDKCSKGVIIELSSETDLTINAE